ncbi:MAG: TIGR04086 family membrane protein [Ruminococcus sp.]|nr:TIGR04086 family membrane protein [Ruminococcus sp.]
MRRHRQSIWTNSLLSLAVSLLCGFGCVLSCAVFFSAITFFLMDNMKLLPVLSGVSLAIGSYVGAFICGKHRRRRGLIEGAICGLFMYLLCSFYGLAALSSLTDIRKLLLLTISGAAGGVTGVNSKRPENLRN